MRPEELSKMFPTPPSHEHHPNSSPCSGGIMDMPMTDITETIKIKQEIYPDLGSPSNEPIEVLKLKFLYKFRYYIKIFYFKGLVLCILPTNICEICWVNKICTIDKFTKSITAFNIIPAELCL